MNSKLVDLFNVFFFYFRFETYFLLVMNEELKADLIIPFTCIDHAKIAYNTLKVDSEPRKNLIKKKLTLEENLIKVSWTSHEAKILRVSVNSFLDHLNSVLETIQLFSN